MSVLSADQPVREILVGSLRRRRPDVRRLVGWSVLEAVPAFLSGLLVARAINSFVADRLVPGLVWLAFYGVSMLVGAWGTRQATRSLGAVVEPFRDELVIGVVTGAVQRSQSPGAPPHTADVARLTEQVEIVREAYAGVLMVSLQFVLVAAGALLGLLTLDASALLFVVPPLGVAVAIFVVAIRRMAVAQRAAIEADERLAASAVQVADGLRDISAAGAEDVVASELARHIDAHARATRALAKLSAVGTMAIAVGSWLPLLLVLGFGGWLSAGDASAGLVVGTVTYILQGVQPALQTLVHGLSGPGLWLAVTSRRVVDSIGGRAGSSADGMTAELRQEPVGWAEAAGLSMTGVTFAYGSRAEPVLRDLDLHLAPDEHLAIIGPSGSGKSTLASVMAGLLSPQHGDVRLGGVDLRDVAPARLAAQRVLIPQQAYVVASTVRDNLSYLNETVPTELLDHAVERLGAGSLVQRLGGYDAMVDVASLTAAGRQHLTLVRAYVAAPSLVILDEATSHLDAATETVVERAFAERPGALVVIAHRISSAFRARRILLLDGVSMTLGTHDELVASSALYRDLVGLWGGPATGPG